jgi:capsular polysaccharide biosynthesis protein
MPTPGRFTERRALTTSIGAGIATFVVVLVVGIGLFVSQPSKVTASSSIVVIPSSTVANDSVAAYYETLSHGQVIATYAEIMRGGDFETQAARTLRLTPGERAKVHVDVRVVTDTALIEVVVTAPDRQIATSMANGIATAATTYVRGLDQPYTLRPVNKATESQDVGISTATLLAVVFVVGLVAGLGAQQLLFQVWLLASGGNRYRRRGAGPTASA